MTRINRVGLSFLSALASESLIVLALTASDRSGPSGFVAGVVAFSIFVIPGWLLSLPAVILFDRADGWRLWVLGIYGALLGPAIILIWAITCKIIEGTDIAYFARFAGIAFVIGLSSTALYLYFFKNSSRDSAEPSSQ